MAWLVPIAGGVVAGLALSAYARSGNGFLVGPGMLAFLIVLGLLAAVGAGLAVWGGHKMLGRQLLTFVATAITLLLLLAIVWPYPPPDGPIPLGRE